MKIIKVQQLVSMSIPSRPTLPTFAQTALAQPPSPVLENSPNGTTSAAVASARTDQAVLPSNEFVPLAWGPPVSTPNFAAPTLFSPSRHSPLSGATTTSELTGPPFVPPNWAPPLTVPYTHGMMTTLTPSGRVRTIVDPTLPLIEGDRYLVMAGDVTKGQAGIQSPALSAGSSPDARSPRSSGPHSASTVSTLSATPPGSAGTLPEPSVPVLPIIVPVTISPPVGHNHAFALQHPSLVKAWHESLASAPWSKQPPGSPTSGESRDAPRNSLPQHPLSGGPIAPLVLPPLTPLAGTTPNSWSNASLARARPGPVPVPAEILAPVQTLRTVPHSAPPTGGVDVIPGPFGAAAMVSVAASRLASRSTPHSRSSPATRDHNPIIHPASAGNGSYLETKREVDAYPVFAQRVLSRTNTPSSQPTSLGSTFAHSPSRLERPDNWRPVPLPDIWTPKSSGHSFTPEIANLTPLDTAARLPTYPPNYNNTTNLLATLNPVDPIVAPEPPATIPPFFVEPQNKNDGRWSYVREKMTRLRAVIRYSTAQHQNVLQSCLPYTGEVSQAIYDDCLDVYENNQLYYQDEAQRRGVALSVFANELQQLEEWFVALIEPAPPFPGRAPTFNPKRPTARQCEERDRYLYLMSEYTEWHERAIHPLDNGHSVHCLPEVAELLRPLPPLLLRYVYNIHLQKYQAA